MFVNYRTSRIARFYYLSSHSVCPSLHDNHWSLFPWCYSLSPPSHYSIICYESWSDSNILVLKWAEKDREQNVRNHLAFLLFPRTFSVAQCLVWVSKILVTNNTRRASLIVWGLVQETAQQLQVSPLSLYLVTTRTSTLNFEFSVLDTSSLDIFGRCDVWC